MMWTRITAILAAHQRHRRRRHRDRHAYLQAVNACTRRGCPHCTRHAT